MPRSFLVKKAERVKVDKSLFCDPDEDEDEGCYGDSYGYHSNVISPRRSCGSPAGPVTSAMAPFTPTTLQPLVVRLANGYIQDLSPPQINTTPAHHQEEPVIVDDIQSQHQVTNIEELEEANEPLSLVTTPASPASPESPASPASPASNHSLASDDDENQDVKKDNNFQEGVTIGYTYDAFFITDGRSRKKNVKKEEPVVPVVEKSRSKYSCNECGKQYATSSNLSRHKQTHRSLDSKNAKKCPHCPKVYVSMPALSMHILTHDLRHQCPICEKAFSRPWLLQGHMRSHSGEKPYGCAHCGKAFADRSNLRAHMQTHSSYKDYKCKRCDKTFALKSYLNKHYESACFKDAESEDSPCSPQSTSSHGSM